MSRGWIIFFVIVGVAIIGWLIWYSRRGKKEVPKAIQETKEVKVEPEVEETGTTIPSLHSQNYKGVSTDVFYLSYVGDNGKSEIEEVSKEKYDQFIRDYPSGTAQGNVIKKYLHECSNDK